MDGVLCDFWSAVLSLWDFDPAAYPANEWDMAKVLGISEGEFWERIEGTPDFWLNLKPYPWAKSLIAHVESSKLPWTVMTSPSMDPECAKQKVQWMRRHIANKFTAYMIGSRKYLLAQPDTLLVDDNDGNVSKFIAAGGQAVLFPARWNSLHAVSDPFAFVSSAITGAISAGDR